MSKKSDLFTDNPEMYFTGSFQEIATIIEKEWWDDKSTNSSSNNFTNL